MSAEAATPAPNLETMAAMLGWPPCGKGEVFMFYMNDDGLWSLMSQYVGPPPEWAMAEWMRRPEVERDGPFRKLNHFTFGLDIIDEISTQAALWRAVEWLGKHMAPAPGAAQ